MGIPDDLCFILRCASRDITRFYEDAFAKSDIRSTQFNILVAMEEKEIGSLTKGAIMLGMDRTTLSRNLTTLVKRGYVLENDGENSRSRGFKLSDKGRNAVKEGFNYIAMAQKRVIDRIGQDEYDKMIKYIRSFIKKLVI